jgi:hypothetical protein
MFHQDTHAREIHNACSHYWDWDYAIDRAIRWNTTAGYKRYHVVAVRRNGKVVQRPSGCSQWVAISFDYPI